MYLRAPLTCTLHWVACSEKVRSIARIGVQIRDNRHLFAGFWSIFDRGQQRILAISTVNRMDYPSSTDPKSNLTHQNPATHTTNVLSIKTPVSVTVVRASLPLDEVLQLAPGVVLQFDKRCTEELELTAGGQRIGPCRAVKIGDNLGVRMK